MKVHAAVTLLPFLLIITISSTSAALRGNDKGISKGKNKVKIFDGTDNYKGNGQGNDNNKSYNDMVIDMKISLENGQRLGDTRVEQLKQKLKQEKLKVNGEKVRMVKKVRMVRKVSEIGVIVV